MQDESVRRGKGSRPYRVAKHLIPLRIRRLLYPAVVKVMPQVRYLEVFWQGLKDSGWTESNRRQESIDSRGLPVPWITYSAIHLLAGRVDRTMRVFEYGAGNSTKWWAGKVGQVVSCEHDAHWVRKMGGLPGSVVLLERGLGNEYVQALHGRGPFDIVVIDGRKRVSCARACTSELSESGVIVFDNTDLPKYQRALEQLESEGFRRLDLVGLGPINPYFWTTSVFYRHDNCLGL